jgi:hypothetical protein
MDKFNKSKAAFVRCNLVQALAKQPHDSKMKALE